MTTCNECKYAIYQDVGYSNYTVEGTDFTCGKNAHPDGTFDRWYGKSPQFNWAENCPEFSEGEPISMDVEGEGVADLTEEQLIIWKNQP